eukprot:CAMPEP_0119145646 /NCGR_PEP_ID=MMETSP1310-20130426/37822_1 /TAXON_ID=464262 /ORGANISM="Genus nov. species nov., Strain RCC2339" /LENGTH=461 /DNA_ID=CAMNT_0007137477 /DNA_START=157 /DNA_END=1539 /DNA_ORIENTATION=+
MNANLRKMQYAVRGVVVARAEEHKETLCAGAELPFKEIIHCNIGNPQEVGNPPITYIRQLSSLTNYPELADYEHAADIFPADVIEKARLITSLVNTGAYSHSQGHHLFREWIAKFIEERDGYPSDPKNIFMTDGASPGIQTVIKALIREKSDAIMIPRPQYPIYSASVQQFGGTQVNYDLDEDNEWALSIEDMENSLARAMEEGTNVRGLCIINPGNPTGQVCNEQNLRDVIDFCKRHNLVLLADEVYQENVMAEGKTWYSAKKILCDMGDEYNDVQLYSFHSTSKGFLGECGKRGGYMEITNVPEDLRAQFYKAASVSLCPNLMGQVTVAGMVNPPQKGDESYAVYSDEKNRALKSLKRRAQTMWSALTGLPGVSCNPPQGAMYLFPKITIPQMAVEKAAEQNMAPDLYYSLKLLDATGIVVVPGSGFGQKDGTFHFRTTFLPSEDKINAVAYRLGDFHC